MPSQGEELGDAKDGVSASLFALFYAGCTRALLHAPQPCSQTVRIAAMNVGDLIAEAGCPVLRENTSPPLTSMFIVSLVLIALLTMSAILLAVICHW